MQVHYRHAFATGSDPLVDNPDFRVQRVRIQLEGDPLRWLSYQVEVDPRAPEIRGILRDAYLTLRFIPQHRLRIGQQKTQFGYENAESSSRLFAVNRTEVSDGLARGVNLRDIGIGLLGHIKLTSNLRFEDAITVVNGAGLNVQADDTPMKNIWGRVGLRYRTEKFWVRLGGSGGIGDEIDTGADPMVTTDDFKLRFRRLGSDLEFDHRWVFASTELVYAWDHTPMENTEVLGWYANVVGKTPWPVGPIARYDTVGTEHKRWTFGLYYGLPDARFRVLLNYELRLVYNGARADDKLYVWAQVRF